MKEELNFVCSACATPLRFTVDTMGRINVEPCSNCIEEITKDNIRRFTNGIETAIQNFKPKIEV